MACVFPHWQHHEANKRSAQVQDLLAVLPTMPLHDHKVVLADHNSVVVPGVDSECISVKDTLSPTVKARNEEAVMLDLLSCKSKMHGRVPSPHPQTAMTTMWRRDGHGAFTQSTIVSRGRAKWRVRWTRRTPPPPSDTQTAHRLNTCLDLHGPNAEQVIHPQPNPLRPQCYDSRANPPPRHRAKHSTGHGSRRRFCNAKRLRRP